jgi:hypothetical protein
METNRGTDFAFKIKTAVELSRKLTNNLNKKYYKITRNGTLHFLFLSYYPLLIFILYFCPGHFSYIIKAIDLILHRMIDVIDK